MKAAEAGKRKDWKQTIELITHQKLVAEDKVIKIQDRMESIKLENYALRKATGSYADSKSQQSQTIANATEEFGSQTDIGKKGKLQSQRDSDKGKKVFSNYGSP